MLCFRRLLAAPFERQSPMCLVSADCQCLQCASNCKWRDACKDIVILSVAGPLIALWSRPQETVSRLLADSQMIHRLSRLLQQSDNWQLARGPRSLRFQARVPDHVWWSACVFPHTLNCVHTLRHVFSRILVSDCASHSAKARSRSVGGWLLVTVVAHK